MSSSDGAWTPRRPARARLVIVAVFVIVGVALILGARSAFNAGLTGDFPIYYRAAVATAEGRSLQQAASKGYLAPPLCAAVMAPLALLSQAAAAQVWTGLTLALFILMIWAGARDAARRWCLPPAPIYAAGIAMAATLLSVGQLRAELRNGQVDGLLVLGFVFGLTLLERRPRLAGVAIGFAANIKYTAIVLIPYLLFRRRYAAAGSAVLSTIAFALLPALVTGWRTNLDNLSISLAGLLRLLGVDIGGHTSSNTPALEYSRSVSLTSAVSRLIPDNSGHGGLYAIVALLALAIAGVCCMLYRRSDTPILTRPATPDAPAVTSLEWCGMIIAVLLFSPQTQVRHMVILLPLHLIAPAIVLLRPGHSRWLIAGLVIAQLGLHLPPGSLISDETSELWRATGWPCWCLLIFFITLLCSGLTACREIRQRAVLS